MTKRTTAKYKIDRRMGENIWGRPKSPVNQRSYGPGQHGQRRRQKISDFGLQLRAKQKLKGYYGNLTEKQFAGTYAAAAKKRGNTAETLIGLLESFGKVSDLSGTKVLGWLGMSVAPDHALQPVLALSLSQVAPVLPYVLLVLVLIVRPKGLLGTREG